MTGYTNQLTAPKVQLKTSSQAKTKPDDAPMENPNRESMVCANSSSTAASLGAGTAGVESERYLSITVMYSPPRGVLSY